MTEKQRKKLDNGREYRAMTVTTANVTDDSGMICEGYAATFNEPYCLYKTRGYEVLEKIDPGAFSETDMSDVIMQYDHEGRVFARTKNNTLSLNADEKGLFIKADLSGTDEGRKLYQEIRGGYTDKMSFGFVVGEDKTECLEDRVSGEKTLIRTILKISKLYDVSAVSIPANDMTSISARKYGDGVIAEIEKPVRERKRKLKLKLEV